jgi:hypothetical protein
MNEIQLPIIAQKILCSKLIRLHGYPANAAGDSLYVGLNGQLVSVTGGAR